MTRLFKTCINTLLFFIPACAFANTDILNVNNQASFDASYHATQINHSIVVDNSQYKKGHQLGMNAGVTKTFFDRLYTKISLEALGGNLSYGKNTPVSTASNVLEQVNFRLGYSYFPAPKVGLTPYFAFGYQYWQLDTGGKTEPTFNRDGETEFYQNGYFGLGLLAQWVLIQKWVLNTDVLLGKSYNPWMRYNAPQVPNATVGKNVIYQQATLGAQPYYQASINLDYHATQKLHAHAGVAYTHTQYSSAISNPSKLVIPHTSIADISYSAGFGYQLDADNANSAASEIISDPIVRANNQASVSYGYVMQNYSETLPGYGHYFDRQEGNIPIINLGLAKTFEMFFTQLNMSLGAGNTEYKGQLLNGTPFNTSTRNTLLDASLKLGYMIFIKDNLGLTPYIVGGFHRWLRDVEGVGTSGYLLYGYPETYQNAWYSLGLLTQYNIKENWIVNVDGNIGTTQHAQNASWNSFASPRTTQQTFSLKQRFIFNLGFGCDYRFAKHWHALGQYNYNYFKYGMSTPSRLGIFEPNSTTHQGIILVGIGVDI